MTILTSIFSVGLFKYNDRVQSLKLSYGLKTVSITSQYSNLIVLHYWKIPALENHVIVKNPNFQR